VAGKTWLGNDLFTGTYGALASSLLVLGVLWTFCFWLCRREPFIRILGQDWGSITT